MVWVTRLSPQAMRMQWPYSSKVWVYQQSWALSPENSLILLLGAMPFLAAGLLEACSVCRGAPGRTVSWLLGLFSPWRCLVQLASPARDDSPLLHVTRIILQGIVIWQHVLLLVDWKYNEGRSGISNNHPVMFGVAEASARVNVSFACLSAGLVYQSVSRALSPAAPPSGGTGRGAKGAAQAAKWGQPDAKRGEPDAKRGVLFCVGTVWAWCAKRWTAQVLELGLWTFYWLRVSPEIPWRPFPDFVPIWYNQRLERCLATRNGPLPMWVLSSLLVYGPAHDLLGWGEHSATTMCHNLAIFETLFLTSCVVAVLVGAGCLALTS